ncbi:hypothetical protein, partial [Nakamurella sp.]|uniref:hypothetical protein n=1 Tax=Nakamurella sp. TaxID=1869182 RepID=UPI003B3A518B
PCGEPIGHRTVRADAVDRPRDPDGDPVGAGGMNARTAIRPAELAQAWHRARFDPDLTVRSQAEDVLFRHYLPLALHLADRWSQHHGDPTGARQTAEIALARAILDWRPLDCSRFEAAARLIVERSLHGTAIDGPAWPRTQPPEVAP